MKKFLLFLFCCSIFFPCAIFGQTHEERKFYRQVCQTLKRKVFPGEQRDYRFAGIIREEGKKRLCVSVSPRWSSSILARERFSVDLKNGNVFELSAIENEWKSIPIKVDFSSPEIPEAEPERVPHQPKILKKPGVERENSEKGPQEPKEKVPEKKAEPIVQGPTLMTPVIYFEYKNAAKGFSLMFPSEIMAQQPEMKNGEGCQFVSRDGLLILTAWGSSKTDGKNTKELFEELRTEFTSVESGEVKEQSMMITGKQGAKICRQKTFLDKGILKSVRFEYPVELREVMDSVAGKILASFSPGG